MRPYRSRPLWATQHRAVESDLRADRQPLVALKLGPCRTTGRLGDATLPVPTAPGDATRSGGGSDLRADRQPLVGLNLGPHRATGRLGDATLPVPTALGDATQGGRVRSPSGPSAIGRFEFRTLPYNRSPRRCDPTGPDRSGRRNTERRRVRSP